MSTVAESLLLEVGLRKAGGGPMAEVGDDRGEQGGQQKWLHVRRDHRRLDVYLQQRLKGISRSRIRSLIEQGGVTLNGRWPKAGSKIHAGSVLGVVLPARAVRRILPEPIELDVLHEDESVIVLNKQAGLVVHPARSHLSGTLLNGLAHRHRVRQEDEGQPWRTRQTRGFTEADGGPGSATPDGEGVVGGPLSPKTGERGTPGAGVPGAGVAGLSRVGAAEFRPGIIHRLDKDTTGVLVIAKTDQAHWAIARQFQERTTLKAYLAVVHGNFEAVGGVIEQPIGKHPTIRQACAVRHDSTAKHAVTLYRVREQFEGYSLVELELRTGRTHQIRVHLSYIGHPVAGDILYGGEPVGWSEVHTPPVPAGGRPMLNFARDQALGRRIQAQARSRADLIMATPALHAALLRFVHPRSGEVVTYTAGLHQPMSVLVDVLRQRRLDQPSVHKGCWVDLDRLAPPCPSGVS